MEEIQATYPEFLALDSSRAYSEFLMERFPSPEAQSRPTAAPATPGEPAVLNITTRAVSDMPSEEDTLGFRPLVDGLDALLNDSRTQLPLAIGLTAPWGSGKSSIMRQLQARLEQPHAAGRRLWHTVWFEAWKYEKSERLWAALAKAIYDTPQEEMNPVKRIRFRLRLEQRRLGWWGFLVRAVGLPALLGAGGFAAVLAIATDFGSTAVNSVDVKDGAAGALAFLTTFAAAGSKFWGVLSHPYKRSLQGHVSRPKYQEQLGFTSEAERDIRHLMETLTVQKDQAIAVFVDDLDRCSSRHVVEIVEAINQILNSDAERKDVGRKSVFMIGIDRSVVAASLEVEYQEMVKHLKESGHPLAMDYGFRFISKVVQMAVAVPTPDPPAMQRLLAKITGDATPATETSAASLEARAEPYLRQIRDRKPANPVDVHGIGRGIEESGSLDKEEREALSYAERLVRSEVFTTDAEHVRQAEREVLLLLDLNPRQVKRFDNAFRLQLHVANGTPGNTLSFSPNELAALGKWVALRLRWPRLAEELDREADVETVVKTLEKEAATDMSGVPEDKLPRYWSLVTGREREFLRELLVDDTTERRISSLPFETFLRVT